MNHAANRYGAIVAAPFGRIGIRTEGEVLVELVYLPPATELRAPDSALAKNVVRQLGRYYDDPEFVFDLPLAAHGTSFQNRVWQAISAIPAGQVRTYGQVARLIGSAPRAVGQACGANFYPLIIPCHRVTAAGGLGGFSNQDNEQSFQSAIKKWLLAHEGANY